jgi:alcohol dehydrogenase class IV
MNAITIYQPGRIVFGAGVLNQLPIDCRSAAIDRILLLYASPLKARADELVAAFRKLDVGIQLLEYALGEPTVGYFQSLLGEAKVYRPGCVIGLGGGSVLDSAKLIAALWNNTSAVTEVFGRDRLRPRQCGLICIPTTSGTGSEVSPNAILLDENDSEKKGVISPVLIPDSCYIDPVLMTPLPPHITAETAMDALSHCIEAYTNRFSHPVVDNYALAGIRLITDHLEAAYHKGSDLEARAALALGSMYGGLCLGPVNTAAVHALSYGLGGKYHIPHGLANAVLLPAVMHFNLPSSPQRYADIAHALGASDAVEGIARIEALSAACGIPKKLSDIGIHPSDVETLAGLAMKVTRLLVNNPREVTLEDAIDIYNTLF